MSFTFGSQPLAFGQPAPAFGSNFGTPATTASTAFGGFGTNTFGSTPQQPAFGSTAFGQPAAGATAPAFGSTTFGQPAAAGGFGTFGAATSSAAPAFGGTGFGTATTAAAPAFGSTFGATASSAAPAFGAFGAPQTSTTGFGSAFGASTTPAFGSTFGAATTTTPSLFGSTPATKPSLFGSAPSTGLFGATPNTTPSLFGTSTTTQAPSLFGSTATTTTPSLFGGTVTTSTPSLFGSSFGATTSAPTLFGSTPASGFGTTATSGLFGTSTSTAPSLFSGFGKPATSTTGFGGFGTGIGGGFGFGTTTTSAPSLFGTNLLGAKPLTGFAQPGQVQPAPESENQRLLSSFFAISIFGDERDNILKKWNMMQACWGIGKGYYNTSMPPVQYNYQNPLYRFKSISYIIIPEKDNSQGMVKLIFNKKESELRNQQEVLSNGILGILGNKPNLSVEILHIKSVSENQAEVTIAVSEKSVTGSSRKVLATELAGFLNQLMQKQQLAGVGVTNIVPYVTPSKGQIESYLKDPPTGIESQVWAAGQAANPNPRKYLPTVVTGFGDLKKRALCEGYECGLHRSYLDKVANDMVELNKKHANSVARINELKQKLAQLYHRVLQILVKQEATRRTGMALQPEEEVLRGRLESMLIQLNIPSQFKAQLQEIKCYVEINKTQEHGLQGESYKIDRDAQEDIKQFLAMEQNGIANLISIVNQDMRDLKLISEGLREMRKHR